MAESRAYNATLNSKGLDASVSEEQARRMCATQGSHSLFLIDAHHGKLVVDEDGTQRIHLIIDTAELVPTEHEDRVRRFMRALYLGRPDQYGQEAFEGTTGDEPTITDTAAALDAVVETDEEWTETGIWDPNQGAQNPGECAYPGCVLDIGHDGDHEYPPVDEPAPDNVVSFSSS